MLDAFLETLGLLGVLASVVAHVRRSVDSPQRVDARIGPAGPRDGRRTCTAPRPSDSTMPGAADSSDTAIGDRARR